MTGKGIKLLQRQLFLYHNYCGLIKIKTAQEHGKSKNKATTRAEQDIIIIAILILTVQVIQDKKEMNKTTMSIIIIIIISPYTCFVSDTLNKARTSNQNIGVIFLLYIVSHST